MKQRIFMLLAFVMAAMTGMTFVSIFTNCYGYNWNGKDGYIFDLSFSSDSKSMTLKAGSASVNFTRID